MEQDSPPQTPVPQRSFMQAFFGAFFSLKEYPLFAERSLISALGHFALLMLLSCSLYAGLSAQWMKTNLTPFISSTVGQIPDIAIKGGVASSSTKQPHIIKIEGTPVVVIDTTRDPKVYLDEYKEITVLSAEHFTTKDSQGTIEQHKLVGDLDISSGIVSGWLDTVASWTLPLLFVLIGMWQFSWKAVQVLLVATVITLVNSSKPGFSTHLRLATYALSPAMAWGLLMFGVRATTGLTVPGAGLVFWGILAGATAMAAKQLKNSPKFH